MNDRRDTEGQHEVTFRVKQDDPYISFIVDDSRDRELVIQVDDHEFLMSPDQARELASWLDSLYGGYT